MVGWRGKGEIKQTLIQLEAARLLDLHFVLIPKIVWTFPHFPHHAEMEGRIEKKIRFSRDFQNLEKARRPFFTRRPFLYELTGSCSGSAVEHFSCIIIKKIECIEVESWEDHSSMLRTFQGGPLGSH